MKQQYIGFIEDEVYPKSRSAAESLSYRFPLIDMEENTFFDGNLVKRIFRAKF